MSQVTDFREIPSPTLADIVGREQVMDIGIRPLWSPVPRIAGPAFTVRCPPGDNLMLHAAIYRGPARFGHRGQHRRRGLCRGRR
ncbi:MAG TPA: hypothetical protein VMA73_28705 [Streptosporangiaceae bacterium]|nr:hypothetical protein [Streptosporangiaceae bacterium]